MLPDGKYSAWYKTDRSDGVGVVEITDGRLFGRDTILEYSGSFIQKGDTFQARISTRRYAEGQVALLGADELDFEFAGTSRDSTAICWGKVAQMPHVPLEVVLVRIEDEKAA